MLTLATVEAALAVGAASLSLSKGSLFKPLHAWVKERSSLLHALVTCPFCLAHWFAALAALFLPHASLVDYGFDVGAIIMLASLAVGIALRLFMWDQLEIDELREENEHLEERIESLITIANQLKGGLSDE